MKDGFELKRASGILTAAVTDTLADMAFLDVLPVNDTEENTAALESRAAIDVLKPTSCRVEIQAPAAFRAKVSEILFPPDEGEEAQDDAFLEILNVITGKFLTAYYGPGTEIKLELPRFLFLDDGSEGQPICSLLLDVEGCRLAIILSSIRYRY